MPSVKLSITCRNRLKAKYDAATLARIDAAVANWVAADRARGITTVHVAVDDAAAMAAHSVPAVTGTVTAGKVKKALDALVARLRPDYVVLFGSGDVVPGFQVANPTKAEDGENTVATDNPYASSQKFTSTRRATYLVPDRVVGRIPDLPKSRDASWLLDYLAAATAWTSRARTAYGGDLFVCCDEWKDAGRACVTFLGRDPARLMISPPAGTASANVRARHTALLHMIKCHGAEADSQFYGQKGGNYPAIMHSAALAGRTRVANVTAAMCCYGASVFDPNDPASVTPGDPPIPSVYLRQGAYGFLGSTTTAWVGVDTMLCADWVVASFLKAVLGGASLGRAALEGKQDFLRWLQQQGNDPDAADEKTLLQFVLLGDPSIHPVKAATPAGLASASLLGANATPAVALARQMRRAVRLELGAALRAALPRITPGRAGRVPPAVQLAARALARTLRRGPRLRISAPRVERAVSTIPGLAPRPAAAGRRALAAGRAERDNRHYYWMARRKTKGAMRDIRLMSIQADRLGNVLRAQVLVSS